MKALGIDIGTSSICGVVTDAGSGEQLDAVTLPNDSYTAGKSAWAREQDVNALMTKCERIYTGALRKWQGIGCIGITGQMHGIIYVDAEGNALSPLYTWEDGRGDLPAKPSGKTYAQALSGLTGCKMAAGYGLTTHYVNLAMGLVPEGACSLCTVMDYLAMRLCRVKRPGTHISNAAGLGLFDLDKLAFDGSALLAAGIGPEMLPEVVREEKIVGHTREDIPVVIPIGDNQAGILGSAASGADVVLNIGTSSQISIIHKQYVSIYGLECRPYVDGKYVLLGTGLCGGSAFGLLNSFFREVCSVNGTVSRERMYEAMTDMAAKAYGKTEGPEVSPLFRGTRADPGKRGVIKDISMDNFTPGALVVGFYRGVCNELLEAYKRFGKVTAGQGSFILSGNAVRNSPVLVSVIEDTFGRKATLAKYREEAAMGAAKLAAAVCERSA